MVTGSAYFPDRGNVEWVDFSPQTGHEQTGRRPAVVLSPRAYNVKTGLAILSPIATRVRGYLLEVPIPLGLEATGDIFADQLKSVDWRA